MLSGELVYGLNIRLKHKSSVKKNNNNFNKKLQGRSSDLFNKSTDPMKTGLNDSNSTPSSLNTVNKMMKVK